MSTKTKKKTDKMPIDQLSEVAQQAGLILMSAAMTIGMLESPDHGATKIVLPVQPAMALAGENAENNNVIRREREETAPHFISYSEVQRTPARSGKA